MLCHVCPKRSVCKSPCLTREEELAISPSREVLLTPKEITELSDKNQAETSGSYDAQRLSPHERRSVVGEALALLSPTQRACVELAVRDQKAATEIAFELGLSRSVVRGHLEKAALRLSHHLGASITPSDLCGTRRGRDVSPLSIEGEKIGEVIGLIHAKTVNS